MAHWALGRPGGRPDLIGLRRRELTERADERAPPINGHSASPCKNDLAYSFSGIFF